MSRILDQPIDVNCLPGKNQPHSFYWQGRSYRITRLEDYWKDTGAWWREEEEKLFFRVATADGGLFELYLTPVHKSWRLYKIYD